MPKKKRMKERSWRKKKLKGDSYILAKKEKDLTVCQKVADEIPF